MAPAAKTIDRLVAPKKGPVSPLRRRSTSRGCAGAHMILAVVLVSKRAAVRATTIAGPTPRVWRMLNPVPVKNAVQTPARTRPKDGTVQGFPAEAESRCST
jgi:hypothetical protein